MNKTTRICLMTIMSLCSFLLLSSCSKAIVGNYIGNLEFKEKYSAYSSLELLEDKTFILIHQTTSFDSTNAITSITETFGRYKMRNNKLLIETLKERNAVVTYRNSVLKSSRVLYDGTGIPIDTLHKSMLIIPVDTTYGAYQILDIPEKTRFKKYKRNGSIYFIGEGAVFSKKIKDRSSFDGDNKCPDLNESTKAPVYTY